MSAARSWGLPLTVKDLTEAAQRKRTYALRVAAGLLFAAMCLAILGRGEVRPGAGRELLVVLTTLLCGTIAVIAPLASASAIAGEREDGSLPLLRMTLLGPWTIVIEKWLSRLIPLLGLALIATPLLALAYVLGGFELPLLGFAIVAIVVTAIQATAIGICASAWCRGTIGAVALSVVVLTAMYVAPLVARGPMGGYATHWTDAFMPIVGAFLSMDRVERFVAFGFGAAVPLSVLQAQMWTSCGVAIGMSVVALLLARIGLGRPEGQATGSRLLGWFRRLDRFFERTETRWLGKTFAREVPERDPVAWRECHRRTLMSPRYLVRITVPLAALAMLAVALTAGRNPTDSFGLISVGVMIALLLALIVFGATTFSAERSSETLPVLLTTPMSAQDILRQKLSGLRRLHLAGALILLLMVGLRAWLWGDMSDTYSWHRWNMFTAMAGIVVLPAVITWVAIIVGLAVRSRARAITMAVGVVIAWIVIGFLVVVLSDEVLKLSDVFTIGLAIALCPVALPFGNELSPFREWPPSIQLTIYLSVHLTIWYVLRRVAFSLADRLLRRATP